MLTAASLVLPGLRHGFFTRAGGVSHGVYARLNCGLGSQDERPRVLQNRAYVAGVLGVAANRLVTVYQAHTAVTHVVEAPFPPEAAPQADALVTRASGIALAVSTADCTPILLADPQARVIGAVHAGWRGARDGVVESCVAAMVGLGARPDAIRAVIGPAIRQLSYEVGAEVHAAFIQVDASFARFFVPSSHADRFLFDLPGIVAARLAAAGVGQVEDMGHDTYADEARFFSYRRMTHRGEADYGRHLHAIVLEG
jgi:YfiH family protein